LGYLIENLADEVKRIGLESGKRASRDEGLGAGYFLDPPLPSEAWRIIVSSGDVRRLPPGEIRALQDLYTAVTEANYVAAQAPVFLEISKLTPHDDVAVAFIREAGRATREPYRSVLPLVERAVELIRQNHKSASSDFSKATA
jgi:hypothetical protein